MPVPNPSSVIVAFSTYCTYSCRFCSRRLGERKKDWWELQQITENLKDLWKDAKVANIGGCGEIGLYPHFYSLLNYLKSRGVKSQFTSNGYHLDVPRIRQGSLGVVGISLHTTDGPTYDSLTGTKGHLPRIIQNIRLLAKRPRNLQLHLIAIAMGTNTQQFPAFARFAKEVEANFTRFIPLVEPTSIGLPDGYDNDLIFHETPQNMEALAEAKEILGNSCIIPLPNQQRHGKVAEGMKTCRETYTQTVINRMGDCVPCCYISGCKLGNVLKEPWDEIWNGEKYQNFRKSMKEGTNSYCLKHCQKWG